MWETAAAPPEQGKQGKSINQSGGNTSIPASISNQNHRDDRIDKRERERERERLRLSTAVGQLG